MNIPENVMIGDRKPHLIPPRMLAVDLFRYHPVNLMKLGGGKPVVMFTYGAVALGGDAAGVNDGLRDGQQTTFLKVDKNVVMYASQDSWVAAGNVLPLA